jgi:ferredoxin/flavodoxin---NADP+ reductase
VRESGRELRVAVVGSGPSGSYAAERLLSRRDISVRVDMFERLTTPWGLVRFGVAPDHLATKSVIIGFERMTRDPRFRLWLNVEVGRDVSTEQLSKRYHSVIYAVGAMGARDMGVPREDLPGSHSATEFVGWYNGHPEYADRAFDFSAERAVVIGNGNVAIDIARILLSTEARLVRTDIAQHALEQLSTSRVREVVVVGRRGPAEAAFTNGERCWGCSTCPTSGSSSTLRDSRALTARAHRWTSRRPARLPASPNSPDTGDRQAIAIVGWCCASALHRSACSARIA